MRDVLEADRKPDGELRQDNVRVPQRGRTTTM
jgi:hypothetical protein